MDQMLTLRLLCRCDSIGGACWQHSSRCSDGLGTGSRPWCTGWRQRCSEEGLLPPGICVFDSRQTALLLHSFRYLTIELLVKIIW